ncbi:hypothetical protein ABB02_00172 [Clostridiaceae bacterium JG1575]|nr:hypothetical protein ABB02_00172 [Clostridiaceae bacterium JG1575]
MNRKNKDLLHLVLTMVGGFMDAYSFLLRGEVFATGQTGNLVLMAIQLSRFQWRGVLHYLLPITAFWLGVFLSRILLHEGFGGEARAWQRGTLLFEVAAFTLIAFIPLQVPHLLVNALIALCAALQFCAFRQLEAENAPFASVFCTGNMRSCAEALYLGMVYHDPREIRKAKYYGMVLTSFILGVVVGVFFVTWWSTYAAFIMVALLLSAFFLHRYHHGTLRRSANAR